MNGLFSRRRNSPARSSNSRTRTPIPEKTYFVAAKGHERGFMERNFTRYFGDDVRWRESVDMGSGNEGFEIESNLSDKVKQLLIARMRQDSIREYHAFLEQKKYQQVKHPAIIDRPPKATQEAEHPGIVDLSPRTAAALAPHLDLFPPLDDLFHSQSASPRSPTVLGHRKCQSTPVTPISTVAPRHEYTVPRLEPRENYALRYNDESLWGPAAFYEESSGSDFDRPTMVPEAQVHHPSTAGHGNILTVPHHPNYLRGSRSVEDFGPIPGMRAPTNGWNHWNVNL